MSDPRLRVLVVCTANVCRSPVAAMMLDRVLLSRGVNAVVESAGLLEPGHVACSNMAAFAAEAGLDLSFHRSRRIDEWMVSEASLIVTMERRHAREIIVDHGGPAARVHTLRGFLRLASGAPPRGEALGDWLIRHAATRPMANLLAQTGDDEIPDPHGQSKRVHRKTFDVLERSMSELGSVLGALAPTPSLGSI